MIAQLWSLLTPHSTMHILYPTQGALNEVFTSRHPLTRPTPTQSQPKPIFSAWSAVEDAKSKAGALSEKAQAELKHASATAQAKAGHIELYSGKYYAACTFGGLIACVSTLVS